MQQWASLVRSSVLPALAVVAVLAAALGAVVPVAAAQEGAPYADVVSDGYYAESVSTLAADGVFAGTECDEGFCPDEKLDRATMAVWTVRVLDGADPAPVASTRFADVDSSHPRAAFIERLAELGVTNGCGDGSNFCPDRTVTRAEMAAFLSRAFGLADGPDPGFGDVPSDAWYAADVARLAASDITVGCGDGTMFCPEDAVTRAQMAAFLARALQSSQEGSSDDGEDESTVTAGGGGGSGGGGGGGAPSDPAKPVVEEMDECGNAAGQAVLGAEDASGAPGAVTELEVTRRSADVVLSWEAPRADGGHGPAGHYRVRWAPSPLSWFAATQAEVMTTGLSCVIGADRLGPDRWTVGVAAVNGAGTSPEVVREVEGTTPSRPQLSATQSGIGEAGVSWESPQWDGVSPVREYWVWWKTGAGDWPLEPQATVASPAMSHAIGGLTPGRHHVRVAAVNDAGAGAPSESLVRVDGLTLLPGHDWMEATWPATPAAVEFTLQWRPDLEASWDDALQATVPAGATVRTIESLTAGGAYRVRVRAEGTFGQAPWAEAGTQLGLLAPRDLTLGEGVGWIAASWEAPKGDQSSAVAKFLMQWRSGDEEYSDTQRRVETQPSVTTATASGLVGNVEHDVRVSALDARGRILGRVNGATRADWQPPSDVQAWGGDERVVVRWGAPWEQPPSATKIRVQWRSGDEEYSDTRRIDTAIEKPPWADVSSLSNGVDYSVRVSAVDAQDGILGSVEAMVRTEPVADFIEREVIERFEEDRPWLRHAWDPPLPSSVTADYVSYYVWSQDPDDSLAWPRLYRSKRLSFSYTAYAWMHTWVHELAHHFTYDYRMGGTQASIAAGWMYFNKLVGSSCLPQEIYASVMDYYVTEYNNSGYLNSCALVGNPPKAEALAVVASISVGDVPQWFYDTYSSDGTADTMDLDLLWDDIVAVGEDRPWGMWPTAYRFRDSFGGYCSEDEALAALGAVGEGGGSGYENPWVDGGCEARWPKALSASGGSAGEIDVSWQAPHYAATPMIDAYLLHWKSGAQDYDSSRQALVTDLSDLSHTITDLVSGTGYTVRVAAVNQAAGTAVLTDDDGHGRAAETAATAG